MLSRLLKVQYCSNSGLLKLLDDAMLLNDAFAQPLHCQNFRCYPVGMQTADCIWQFGVLAMILVVTLRTSTELAQEGLLLFKLSNTKTIAHPTGNCAWYLLVREAYSLVGD